MSVLGSPLMIVCGVSLLSGYQSILHRLTVLTNSKWLGVAKFYCIKVPHWSRVLEGILNPKETSFKSDFELLT